MGVALATLPAAPRLVVLLALLGIVAAGQALASPTLSTLVSHASEGAEHGALLGASQSLAAMARAVGPVIAGQLYDLHAAAPYVTAGKDLQAGEFFFFQGDPAERMFILVRGRVKLSQMGPDGQQALIRVIAPVSLFALVAITRAENYLVIRPGGRGQPGFILDAPGNDGF